MCVSECVIIYIYYIVAFNNNNNNKRNEKIYRNLLFFSYNFQKINQEHHHDQKWKTKLNIFRINIIINHHYFIFGTYSNNCRFRYDDDDVDVDVCYRE